MERLILCEHYYGEMDLTKVDYNLVASLMQEQSTVTPKIQKLLTKQAGHFEKNFGIDLLTLSNAPLFSILNELTLTLFQEDLIPGSIDEELLKKAIQAKLTLGGLETFEEQAEIMSSLKDKHLEKQIISILKKPKDHSRSLSKMFRWFLKGKTNKLYKYAHHNMQGNSNILIDKRNKLMTFRILDIIRTQDKNFFSFGAGHLKGPNGIITILKKNGMIVEKC